VRNVEIFHLGEDDLLPAETFLHELLHDLAFGQGPAVRATVETSTGASFTLLPSEEGRLNLFGVTAETFEGHEGSSTPWSRATAATAWPRFCALPRALRRRERRRDRRAARRSPGLAARVQGALPAQGPDGTAHVPRNGRRSSRTRRRDGHENLWVEVISWGDEQVIGKLVDGGQHTTEWRKGAQVEVAEDTINAIAVQRDGKHSKTKRCGRCSWPRSRAETGRASLRVIRCYSACNPRIHSRARCRHC